MKSNDKIAILISILITLVFIAGLVWGFTIMESTLYKECNTTGTFDMFIRDKQIICWVEK